MNEKETILLVEDDGVVRDSCRQALEQVGYHVIEASSGQEAEAILLRETVDLIITDLRMPEGDGQELVEYAQDVLADLPIVLITAYPTVESAVKGFKSGVIDYLVKPFTGDQLIEVAKSALKARRTGGRTKIHDSMRSQTLEASSSSPRRAALGKFDKKYLIRVLQEHGGNISRASRSLGIHRTTLQRLVKKYGVNPRT